MKLHMLANFISSSILGIRLALTSNPHLVGYIFHKLKNSCHYESPASLSHFHYSV